MCQSLLAAGLTMPSFWRTTLTSNLRDRHALAGIGNVQIFGGQYAIAAWVNQTHWQSWASPSLKSSALSAQNTVNPPEAGANCTQGQEFIIRFSHKAACSPKSSEIVLRETPMGDRAGAGLARIELAPRTKRRSRSEWETERYRATYHSPLDKGSMRRPA